MNVLVWVKESDILHQDTINKYTRYWLERPPSWDVPLDDRVVQISLSTDEFSELVDCNGVTSDEINNLYKFEEYRK